MEILQKLTETDFKLINEGLDILCQHRHPEKIEIAKREIMERVKEDISLDDPRHLKKLQDAVEDFTAKKRMEFEQANENIRLLQGKLILLKRQLAEQAQVNAANDLLK